MSDTISLTLNAAESAALVGIGRTKFLQLHSSGRTPLPMRFGRSVRWRRDELKAWVNAGCPPRDRWRWVA